MTIYFIASPKTAKTI